jgi:D-tagatose-1,6-bisphosphate aldolase subunit GatZ/KbaZ
MNALENKLLSVIKKHKSGELIGITSICSVNEYVIKAAILNAKKNSNVLLIESTSNQVDQFGGYTGMTPLDFREMVSRIAGSLDYPKSSIVLGGDHLGPNVWSNQSSAIAMENAKEQIRTYIKVGYSKIHLDTSMKCADDKQGKKLSPSIIAERAAILCKTAEDQIKKSSDDTELPVYVIGTDVPPPGGAKEENAFIVPTLPHEVEETISLTKQAFFKYNLYDAWDRVIAVVVQPGVEFGDEEIFNYDRNKASGLKKEIEENVSLVYEAHSTDFQQQEMLRQMVEDHFVILKVGPWLTYAFREALFALEIIEKEVFTKKKDIALSDLTNILEIRMKQNPKYWRKYYIGESEEELSFKRKYSLSDRIRYYWNDSVVQESLLKLLHNLAKIEIPSTLISQFLPESFDGTRCKQIKNLPEVLIINRILKVIDKYNYATIGTN